MEPLFSVRKKSIIQVTSLWIDSLSTTEPNFHKINENLKSCGHSCLRKIMHKKMKTLPVSRKDILSVVRVDNHHNRQYDILTDKCGFHMDTIYCNSYRIAKLSHRSCVPEHCYHIDKIVCFSSNMADTSFYHDKSDHTRVFHTSISTCTEKLKSTAGVMSQKKFPSIEQTLDGHFQVFCAQRIDFAFDVPHRQDVITTCGHGGHGPGWHNKTHL